MMVNSTGQISEADHLKFNFFRFFLLSGLLFSIGRTFSSLSTGSPSTVAPLIVVLFTLLLIAIHWKRSLYFPALLIMFYLSFIGASISYITRGEKGGPGPFLFFIGFVVVIILFEKKWRTFHYVLLFVWVITMFYFRPVFNLPIVEFTGTIDIKMLFISSIVLLGAIVVFMKSALIHSNDLIASKNKELESKRLLLENQKVELQKLHNETIVINRNLEQMVSSHTEEVENRNKELAEYAYVNAHLLRAPLTRIMGLTDLLINHHKIEKKKSLSDIGSKAGETDQVIKKINDILN